MIPGKTIKILLVDDTDKSYGPLRRLILRGYDVEWSTINAASSSILQFWPDIVVICQHGTSFQRTIKESPITRWMRVIQL